eukprot:5875425-Pleurochrysis_carterae.AAC.1
MAEATAASAAQSAIALLYALALVPSPAASIFRSSSCAPLPRRNEDGKRKWHYGGGGERMGREGQARRNEKSGSGQ